MVIKKGNFEVFRDTGKTRRSIASISTSGRIALNEGAFTEFGLAEVQYVIQMYDPDAKLIGIELLKEKEIGAVKLQRRNKSGVFFLATPFLEKYGLVQKKSSFFEIYKHETMENTLVIDMNQRINRKGREQKE